MTGSTDPNAQHPQQQPGSLEAGAPASTPAIQIPPQDPNSPQQQQFAQQQPLVSPVGYASAPPLGPPQPFGAYPQQPPSPGGYPQAPPSPGGYQQQPPSPYGPPSPFQQTPQSFYGQPMYYPQQPPQPYGQPPQSPYQGQPPLQQPSQPPQQPGQPPQQGQYPQPPYHPQYGYPPPQAPYYPQQPPPQGFPHQPGYASYGQQPLMDSSNPLTGSYNSPLSARPRQYSPGYLSGQAAVGYDPSTDATIIKKALDKDRKIDLDAILKILPNLTPLQIESLKPQLYRHGPQELTTNATLTDETVKLGIHGLLYGPRDFDAFLINRAISDKVKFGSSFKYTWMLSLALLGKKNGDIDAIKEAYKRMYGDTMLPLLKEALKKESLLANLYMNALESHSNPGLSEVPEANRAALQEQINKEADELFTATVGNVEGNRFAWIFTTSSEERLKDIATAFIQRQSQTLASVVEKKLKKTEAFRDELLYILRGIEDRAKRDAELLENTMKGFGTKDTQLIFRILSITWDKQHLTKVKDAYKHKYPHKGSLLVRIEGDTSGEQEKFLRALVQSDGKK